MEVIKPYLRGQDIKRWSPEWNGLWMIVLKSSGDHAWPWSEAEEAPRGAGRLTPAALKELRAGYEEQANPVRADRAEAAALERRLSDLVNRAYELTPEDVSLLWSTAPPRMPGSGT